MDDALKGEIIDTIKGTYLCELCNQYTGNLRVNIRDLPASWPSHPSLRKNHTSRPRSKQIMNE